MIKIIVIGSPGAGKSTEADAYLKKEIGKLKGKTNVKEDYEGNHSCQGA